MDFSIILITNFRTQIKETMKSYYVDHSFWFGSHNYDAQLIGKAVVGAGGSKIRLSYTYGWSNQPKVVCFDCEEDQLKQIQEAVEKACNTGWIIILEKDWGRSKKKNMDADRMPKENELTKQYDKLVSEMSQKQADTEYEKYVASCKKSGKRPDAYATWLNKNADKKEVVKEEQKRFSGNESEDKMMEELSFIVSEGSYEDVCFIAKTLKINPDLYGDEDAEDYYMSEDWHDLQNAVSTAMINLDDKQFKKLYDVVRKKGSFNGTIYESNKINITKKQLKKRYLAECKKNGIKPTTKDFNMLVETIAKNNVLIKEGNTEERAFKDGEEVDFHGRSGKVTGFNGSYYTVYFSDEDEEEEIDSDELKEQNGYGEEDEDIMESKKIVLTKKQLLKRYISECKKNGMEPMQNDFKMLLEAIEGSSPDVENNTRGRLLDMLEQKIIGAIEDSISLVDRLSNEENGVIVGNNTHPAYSAAMRISYKLKTLINSKDFNFIKRSISDSSNNNTY